MEMVKNAVAWFEIPVKDFSRAKKFYEVIFDYEMPEMQMGPNRMGFLLFEQDGIGGAIVEGEGYVPAMTGTLVYLSGGSDLDVVLKRVVPAGGKVLMPKMLITPEYGYCALFQDVEGNRVGLHSIK